MNAGKKIRVLIQNRPTARSHRGGDTVVMEKIAEGLSRRGVDVVVDLEGREDAAKFDLVHLFNFATPEFTTTLGQRAVQAGRPFVVTTLCEDVENFSNQSALVAQTLTEYVNRNQDSVWYQAHKPDLNTVPRAKKFDNEWLVKHAAALYTTGARETQVIQRLFGKSDTCVNLAFGYEVGEPGDAEAFVREYGVKDFVLCVGRIESRKNQLMLLKALEHSELTVVLAGGGVTYQPDYLAAVKKFKRKGKTIILDRLSPKMLASAYAAARIHVLPSWYELPGLVSLEAAYYGCNVVATFGGTAWDCLGDQAFYCDPGSEHSIYNAVVAAYLSPRRPELKECVLRGTWDRHAEAIYQNYKKILGVVEQSGVAVQSTQGVANDLFDFASGISEFQELVERGEIAARAKDFPAAHEILSRAEQLNPTSLRALRSRGVVFLAEGKTKEAESYLKRAQAIDAGDLKTNSGLGMCFMMQRQPEIAYPYLLTAVRGDPDQLVAILQFMECVYSLSRFDDLEQVLRTYLRNNPSDSNMQFCLAGCLFRLGKIDQAREVNRTVLTMDPSHLGATDLQKEIDAAPIQAQQPGWPQPLSAGVERLTATSVFDDEMGRLETAKREKNFTAVRAGCDRIIADNNASVKTRQHAVLLRAEVAVLEGDLERGEKVYDEVLKNDPVCARALCGKGTLAAARGDWNTAYRYFEQAQRLEGAYDLPYAGLGLYYSWKGDVDQSWNHFCKALDLNPENLRALLGIIEVGLPQKRYLDVERYLSAYLEIHPADLDFLYTMAGCYYAQGRVGEAVDALNKITMFDPQNPKALELKSMIESSGVAA